MTILIPAAISYGFLWGASTRTQKERPGLNIQKDKKYKQCNINNTIQCDTNEDCKKECQPFLHPKCFNTYYQYYVATLPPSMTPSTSEFLINDVKGWCPANATLYKYTNGSPSGTFIKIGKYSDIYIKSTENKEDGEFGPVSYINGDVRLYPIKIDTSSVRDIKYNSQSNIMPIINEEKTDLKTCVDSNKDSCAYWQYNPNIYHQYVLSGDREHQFYWGNYISLSNLVNMGDVNNIKDANNVCNRNVNCKGFFKTTAGRYGFVLSQSAVEVANTDPKKCLTRYNTFNNNKTCSPSDFDLDDIFKRGDNIEYFEKTCSYYTSRAFRENTNIGEIYFSPSMTTVEKKFNMKQNCNNQAMCIWRNVYDDGNWQTLNVSPSSTAYDELNKIFENEDTLSHDIYYRTGTGTSNSKIRLFCNTKRCKELFGEEQTTPDDLNDVGEIMYKIDTLECNKVLTNLYDKVRLPQELTRKQELQTRLCSLYMECAGETFDCIRDTYSVNNTKCNKNAEITKLIKEMDTLKDDKDGMKRGVCLTPPEQYMSSNVCNVYTSNSVVVRKDVKDDVCNNIGKEKCIEDSKCVWTNNMCTSFCGQFTDDVGCKVHTNCKWNGNNNTCTGVTYAYKCQCDETPAIRNLFINEPDKCTTLQPNLDVMKVTYYKSGVVAPSVLPFSYMVYNDKCCRLSISPSAAARGETAAPDDITLKPFAHLPRTFKNKCDKECTLGERQFGKLVIPNCSLISTNHCQPSSNKVDPSWPCEIKNGMCTNKSEYPMGKDWYSSCYTTINDKEIYRPDTCWNPLYGVLSPCGIEQGLSGSFNGQLDDYMERKSCTVKSSCCDNKYDINPYAANAIGRREAPTIDKDDGTFTKITIPFPATSFKIPDSAQKDSINKDVYQWQQGWKDGWESEYRKLGNRSVVKQQIPLEYRQVPIINTKFRVWPTPPDCVYYSFSPDQKNEGRQSTICNSPSYKDMTPKQMGEDMGKKLFNNYVRYINR